MTPAPPDEDDGAWYSPDFDDDSPALPPATPPSAAPVPAKPGLPVDRTDSLSDVSFDELMRGVADPVEEPIVRRPPPPADFPPPSQQPPVPDSPHLVRPETAGFSALPQGPARPASVSLSDLPFDALMSGLLGDDDAPTANPVPRPAPPGMRGLEPRPPARPETPAGPAADADVSLTADIARGEIVTGCGPAGQADSLAPQRYDAPGLDDNIWASSSASVSLPARPRTAPPPPPAQSDSLSGMSLDELMGSARLPGFDDSVKLPARSPGDAPGPNMWSSSPVAGPAEAPVRTEDSVATKPSIPREQPAPAARPTPPGNLSAANTMSLLGEIVNRADAPSPRPGPRAGGVSPGGDPAADQMSSFQNLFSSASSHSPTAVAPVGSPVKSAASGKGTGTVPGYEILGELGRGGMGVVYKARHKGLNRIVALKMILAGGNAGADELHRFRLEAQAVANLKHPNIVKIFEAKEHDGHPYCTLEFLEGGSLQDKLEGAPQPPRAAAETMEVLCRAMYAAHQQGILHRDLKPANVLLAKDGTPKITDFGLAKQLDADQGQTRTGMVMGTPTYMAPEQAAGKVRDLGPPADIYSLGVMLYEMLVGRTPLRGETVMDTLFMVQSQEPIPPSRLQPGVPADLETICMKCLRKSPHARYQTALEVADDLRRFLDGKPIDARPPSTVEKAVNWVKQYPTYAALVGSGGVLLLLAIIGGAAFTVVNNAWADAHRRTAEEAETARAAAKRSEAEAEAGEQAAKTKKAAADALAGKSLVECERAMNAVQAMLDRVGRERLQDQPAMARLRHDILTRALRVYAEVAAVSPEEPGVRLQAGIAHRRAGEVLIETDDLVKAESELRLSVATIQPLTENEETPTAARRELARANFRLGMLLADAGRLPEAEPLIAAAIEGIRRLGGPDDRSEPTARRELAVMNGDWGGFLLRQGDGLKAEPFLAAAHDLSAKLAGTTPDAPTSRNLARAKIALAGCRVSLGRLSDAEPLLVDALSAYERLTVPVGKNAPTPDDRFRLALTNAQLGQVRLGTKDRAAAETHLRAAITGLEALVKEQPLFTEYSLNLIRCQRALGEMLEKGPDPAGALVPLDHAVRTGQDLDETFRGDGRVKPELGRTFLARAGLNVSLGRKDQAEADYRAARACIGAWLTRKTTDAEARRLLTRTLEGLIGLLDRPGASAGEHHEAETLRQELRATPGPPAKQP